MFGCFEDLFQSFGWFGVRLLKFESGDVLALANSLCWTLLFCTWNQIVATELFWRLKVTCTQWLLTIKFPLLSFPHKKTTTCLKSSVSAHLRVYTAPFAAKIVSLLPSLKTNPPQISVEDFWRYMISTLVFLFWKGCRFYLPKIVQDT